MTRVRKLSVVLALICLSLGACVSAPAPAPSGTAPVVTPNPSAHPLIFFGALPPYVPHMGYAGSTDYFDLFMPNAPWKNAASNVGVYMIAASFIMNYWTPEQLRQVVTDVAARGMALGLEIGAFYPSTCGWGIEGFDAGLEPLQRIRDAGGRVNIVIFDEPYAFAVRDPSSGACHWSVEQAAQEAVTFVRQLRQFDQEITIGETEPLWPGITATDIAGWLDAYAKTTGQPMAFLHLDADWTVADWATIFLDTEKVARARGIEVGPIYNGGDATSDAQWTDLAMQRAYTYEEVVGGRPDHVVLQSWFDHPDRVLPETDPTTFTGLINRYLAPRTTINIAGATSPGAGWLAVVATLTSRGGAPIASAPVSASLTPIDGARQVLRLDGVVPDQVSAALAGVRVNLEGVGPANADMRIYGLSFAQNGAVENRIKNPNFSSGLANWGIDSTGQVTATASDTGPGQMLRVRATPTQHIVINGANFAVSPGATFRFEVTAAVPADSAASAYATIMFLKANTETHRVRVALAPVAIDEGRQTTTATGRVIFDLRNLAPGRYRLRLEYPGDLGHWPAFIEREVLVG